jgi:hypothetical protein
MIDPVIKEQVDKLKEQIASLNLTLAELQQKNVLVHLSIEKNNSIDPTSIKLLLASEHIDYLNIKI